GEAEQSQFYERRVLLRRRRNIHHGRGLFSVRTNAPEWRSAERKTSSQSENGRTHALGIHTGHAPGPRSWREFRIERACGHGPDSKRYVLIRRQLWLERSL